MLFDPKYGQYLGTLEAELRRARGLTPELMSEVMTQACGCFAPHEQAAIRGISRLIEAGACVDAVLAMIALELPQWKLRRGPVRGWRVALLALEPTAVAD